MKNDSLVLFTARKLRKFQTDSEKLLWDKLRNRKLFNHKFYRQYTIKFIYENLCPYGHINRFFIADFYNHNNKLIIEIDGKIHEYKEEYDKFREYLLTEMNYKVIRFKNEEIENCIDICLKKIKENLTI